MVIGPSHLLSLTTAPLKRPKSEPRSVPPVSAGATSSRKAETVKTLSPVMESGSSLTGVSSSPLSSEGEGEVEEQPTDSAKKRKGNDSWLTQSRAPNGKFLSKSEREMLRHQAEQGQSAEEEADAEESGEIASDDVSDVTEVTEKADDDGDDDDEEMTPIPLTSPHEEDMSFDNDGDDVANKSDDEGNDQVEDEEDVDMEPDSAATSPPKIQRRASTRTPRSSRSPKKARTFTSSRAAPAAKSLPPEDLYPPGTLGESAGKRTTAIANGSMGKECGCFGASMES